MAPRNGAAQNALLYHLAARLDKARDVDLREPAAGSNVFWYFT